jgi:hypothetical protein
MVGRIYLAKIYFTDLSEYKIRPVLVLRVYGEDCLCLPLTSNLRNSGDTTLNYCHPPQIHLNEPHGKDRSGGSISVRAGVAIKTHDRQDQQILGNVSFR